MASVCIVLTHTTCQGSYQILPIQDLINLHSIIVRKVPIIPFYRL